MKPVSAAWRATRQAATTGEVKLCTTMKAVDVTETLKLALQASSLDQVHVVHRPRLLSDNGSSYISGDLEAKIGDFV